MGWRFRKSTKVGPFRITASKSGVSYSVGGKGYRVTKLANGKTRTTVSIPGTGVSYSEITGGQPEPVPVKDRPTSPKSKAVALVLCGFLGFLGVHRFYVDKIGTGLLYLLTMGGFCIGWIVDFFCIAINRFTDGSGYTIRGKQGTVQPYRPPLPGDTEPIPATRETAQMLAPQWLKQAVESGNICNTTVNPETFFSRYDFMLLSLRRLSAIEHLVSFSGNQPSAELKRMQEQRPAAVQSMIERSYHRMIEEARELKTTAGQNNRVVNYFHNMEQYTAQMGAEGAAYLQSLKERHIVR